MYSAPLTKIIFPRHCTEIVYRLSDIAKYSVRRKLLLQCFYNRIHTGNICAKRVQLRGIPRYYPASSQRWHSKEGMNIIFSICDFAHTCTTAVAVLQCQALRRCRAVSVQPDYHTKVSFIRVYSITTFNISYTLQNRPSYDSSKYARWLYVGLLLSMS